MNSVGFSDFKSVSLQQKLIMKKGWLIFSLVIIFVAVYFLFFYKPAAKEQPVAAQTFTGESKNDPAFNRSIDSTINLYFSIHDAFVNWDTAKANKAADSLQSQIENVPFDLLNNDISVIATAKNFSTSIENDAQAITKATTIEAKRRSFNTMTENLYNLLRTVQYDKQVIYHQMCPMAFNDTEQAFWLSQTAEIVNPYLGARDPKYKSGMLHCGETVDSIDFRR